MSLAKIDDKLRELGLTKKQREAIIEMVRDWGHSILERHIWFTHICWKHRKEKQFSGYSFFCPECADKRTKI